MVLSMLMPMMLGNGTYERKKKKSFDWYKKVIETNGDYLNEEA